MNDLDQSPGPTTTRRRRWPLVLLTAVAVLAALVLVALVGLRVYAAARSDEAAAPLTPPAPSAPAASATSAASDAALDGDWLVASGGTAGYRVDEVLNGQDVTVTGRTDQVTGAFTLAAGSLTAGQVTVDLASTSTDSERRDEQFVEIVGAAANPTSTFTLTGAVPLGGLEATGTAVAVTLPGTLVVNGVSQDVAADATATRTDADTITVTGSLPLTWSDHGIETPDYGFVAVEDTGVLEFQVTADRT